MRIKQVTISLQWLELVPKKVVLKRFKINPELTDKFFSWLIFMVHVEYRPPKDPNGVIIIRR
jgi:hypothetical protein